MKPDDISVLLHVPRSDGAEQAVLGGLLLDNRAWDRICDLLTEQDFFRSEHRAIWRHIGALIEANKPADLVTLEQRIEPELVPYLGELFTGTPSAYNIRAYAQIVRDRSILRRLTAAATEIAEASLEPGADAQECAAAAEAKILAILDGGRASAEQELFTLKDAVFDAVEWIEAKHDDGIRTGYAKLDEMFPGGGMQPEQMIVIAGRPGMGKSTLAWCIAEHAAKAGKTTAYFALETSAREVGLRALRWHESLIAGGRSEAIKHLSNLPILIDPTPAISLAHLRVRLRRIRRQRGALHLAVIDYVQLMTHRAQDRLQEISAISRGLKTVAKEFGIPVIAVCQLNRAAEMRQDHRPVLADLRESGQLEQDADAVIMLYRDEVYHPNTHLKGYGEALVRKMRDGPIGEVLLKWEGARTRWVDHAGPWPQPQADTVVAGDSKRVRQFRPKGEPA